MSDNTEFKFAVDCMLGKLAKALRIMGFDTFYENFIEDSDLVDIAYDEDRIILTRDVGLTKRKKAIKYLLIKDIDSKKQIKQIMKEFNLKAYEKPLTRCIECNSLLKPIEKEKVKDKVPKYTFSKINDFFICEGCNKIYWSASHVESIKKEYGI